MEPAGVPGVYASPSAPGYCTYVPGINKKNKYNLTSLLQIRFSTRPLRSLCGTLRILPPGPAARRRPRRSPPAAAATAGGAGRGDGGRVDTAVGGWLPCAASPTHMVRLGAPTRALLVSGRCARGAAGRAAAAAARASGAASRQAPPAPAPVAVTSITLAPLQRRAAVVGERAGHRAAATCLTAMPLGFALVRPPPLPSRTRNVPVACKCCAGGAATPASRGAGVHGVVGPSPPRTRLAAPLRAQVAAAAAASDGGTTVPCIDGGGGVAVAAGPRVAALVAAGTGATARAPPRVHRRWRQVREGGRRRRRCSVANVAAAHHHTGRCGGEGVGGGGAAAAGGRWLALPVAIGHWTPCADASAVPRDGGSMPSWSPWRRCLRVLRVRNTPSDVHRCLDRRAPTLVQYAPTRPHTCLRRSTGGRPRARHSDAGSDGASSSVLMAGRPAWAMPLVAYFALPGSGERLQAAPRSPQPATHLGSLGWRPRTAARLGRPRGSCRHPPCMSAARRGRRTRYVPAPAAIHLRGGAAPRSAVRGRRPVTGGARWVAPTLTRYVRSFDG
ncbi:hypothetical protein BU14_0666s0003 [Porphyra umbilicalis]|uniref:Uncharacterized protein n=1 Tax=Porphyra umbilicalis TaxID=2786 RepID=A0A1X6NQD0_PORUM|nr:hypothetical protein BU14_0666s0003 [Porphyra umbilicalis]|eukprot:OSX70797.1 hypothetical protein BU14_0666s0003 [Porphyra umbilicalis]